MHVHGPSEKGRKRSVMQVGAEATKSFLVLIDEVMNHVTCAA